MIAEDRIETAGVGNNMVTDHVIVTVVTFRIIAMSLKIAVPAKGYAKKNSDTRFCFLRLRPQKAPLLPISEIITKLSKTLITLLCYILPQPP